MSGWPRLSRRAAIAAVTALGVGHVGAAPSAWRAGIATPRGRSETAAATIDGRIYLAGGFGGEHQVDCFDTATGEWNQVADLPLSVHHPGVAALDGLLYVAGGYETSQHRAVATVQRYDPASDRWSLAADLPVAKGAFGLVAAAGRLWTTGGAAERLGGPALGDVAIYDPAADRWTTSPPPLPVPREHLAVVAIGQAIYAIGGRANGDESNAIAGRVDRFDIDRGAWETLAELPVPRGGLAGVAMDDRVVVLGGERGDKLFAAVDCFDPASGTWSALPPMPTARHGLMATFLEGVLYAMAGSVLAGRVDNVTTVELWEHP